MAFSGDKKHIGESLVEEKESCLILWTVMDSNVSYTECLAV